MLVMSCLRGPSFFIFSKMQFLWLITLIPYHLLKAVPGMRWKRHYLFHHTNWVTATAQGSRSPHLNLLLAFRHRSIWNGIQALTEDYRSPPQVVSTQGNFHYIFLLIKIFDVKRHFISTTLQGLGVLKMHLGGLLYSGQFVISWVLDIHAIDGGGGGTLKESLGKDVPQKPIIPDPLKTKIAHLATLFETRGLVFLGFIIVSHIWLYIKLSTGIF